MLFSIHFYGQDKIQIDAHTLQDILISEAEYKAESESLKKDTTNLRLIIKNKDVIITNYLEIVSNDADVKKALQNALDSFRLAYEEEKKNSKKKGIKSFFQGSVFGSVVFWVIMLII